MVVKVQLRGLNVRQSRGKWYVSIRATGDSLLKGFEGDRKALNARLEDDDILAKYTRLKTRDRSPVYAEGTLGDLVRWFKAECPAWDSLSEASKADYEKTFLYLEPEFDAAIGDIAQADIYNVRNKAAKAKWGRFADKMLSHLSKMFREAIKAGRAHHNPAAGVEKLHKADPNANHEWRPEEVSAALSRAPRWILTPLILARYQGFRGQTCHALVWSEYIADPQVGRAFDLRLRKNDDQAWFPAEPETRAHLDRLDRTSTQICTTSDGVPWKSEKTMQGAVSDFLAELKRDGAIRKGCTLHGLRVTYAASLRRMGLDARTVADALGDRSSRMGEHYTRHVEREAGRLRAYTRKNGVQNGEVT